MVRGTNGTFTKYGTDPQEEQVGAITSPSCIFDQGYGLEPEKNLGFIEKLEHDGKAITKSKYGVDGVSHLFLTDFDVSWPSDRGQYVELFKNLAAAIREGGELRVKWTEVTQLMEMIELVYKSARENRTVKVLASGC